MTIARARQLAAELLQVLDALSEQPELPLSRAKMNGKTKRTDRPALLITHYERVMAAAGRAIGVALTPVNRAHVACLDPYEMAEAEALISAYCSLDDAFCSVEGYPLRLLPDKLPKVLAAREAAASKKRTREAARDEVLRHERAAEAMRPKAEAGFSGPPPEFSALLSKLGGRMSLPEGDAK